MSSTGVCFLFTQAEVGIRGGHVTGVQTCALPICPRTPDRNPRGADVQVRRVDFDQAFVDSTITNTSGAVPTLTALERLESNQQVEVLDFDLPAGVDVAKVRGNRSEERRVGEDDGYRRGSAT